MVFTNFRPCQHGLVLILGMGVTGCGSSPEGTKATVPAATSRPAGGAASPTPAASGMAGMHGGAGGAAGAPGMAGMGMAGGASPAGAEMASGAQGMSGMHAGSAGRMAGAGSSGSMDPAAMAAMGAHGAQGGAGANGAGMPAGMAGMAHGSASRPGGGGPMTGAPGGGAGHAGGPTRPGAAGMASAPGMIGGPGMNGAAGGGPGMSGGQGNSFKQGSADDVLYKFCSALSENDSAAASDYVSSKAKGMVGQLRDGQLSQEKIDEIESAVTPLNELEPMPNRSNGKRSLRNKRNQVLSFTLKKEKDEDSYKITEFTLGKPKA